MGISHIRCREIMYQLCGNHVITFTGKLNLICKKKPTIFMKRPNIRCREIMYTANILLVKKATFPYLFFPILFQCIKGSENNVKLILE